MLKLRNHNKLLSKRYLIYLLNGNAWLYSKYLPNSVNLDKLYKSFLFVIFQLISYIDPSTYSKLYGIYKNQESQKAYKN